MLDQISAKEILKKIENQEPLKLSRKLIKGDLDLSQIKAKLDENGKKTITESIVIDNSIIDGSIIFENIAFLGFISFLNTSINNLSHINEVEFHNSVEFAFAEFHEGLMLTKSKFKKDVGFLGTKFYCFANLSSNTFRKDIYLVGAKFLICEKKSPPRPDLSENWTLGNVTFSGSRFLGVINIEGEFQGEINLSNIQFDKLYVRWELLKDKAILDDTTHLLLIENFKNLGFFEDADNCYYDYRKTRNIKSYIRKIFDLAARFSFGYGVKPEFALASSIIFIILFSILFYYFNGIIDQDISIKNALVLSMTAFTSGATTIISSPNMPILNGNLSLFATIEKLLGWAFFALLLVSLGKTIIR